MAASHPNRAETPEREPPRGPVFRMFDRFFPCGPSCARKSLYVLDGRKALITHERKSQQTMDTKPEKFLRLTEVQKRVPYSRSTIYLKVSRGEFPKPIDLGARAVAWLESDVDEWIASRISKSRTEAA